MNIALITAFLVLLHHCKCVKEKREIKAEYERRRAIYLTTGKRPHLKKKYSSKQVTNLKQIKIPK